MHPASLSLSLSRLSSVRLCFVWCRSIDRSIHQSPPAAFWKKKKKKKDDSKMYRTPARTPQKNKDEGDSARLGSIGGPLPPVPPGADLEGLELEGVDAGATPRLAGVRVPRRAGAGIVIIVVVGGGGAVVGGLRAVVVVVVAVVLVVVGFSDEFDSESDSLGLFWSVESVLTTTTTITSPPSRPGQSRPLRHLPCPPLVLLLAFPRRRRRCRAGHELAWLARHIGAAGVDSGSSGSPRVIGGWHLS
jgi:hypothetical protein